MNEWKKLLLYLFLWTNIFMNKNRIVAASFMFTGIESRIFVLVLVISSWISPKISSKSCGVMCWSLLYYDSSSNFSFCTSVCLDKFSSSAKALPTRIFFSFPHFFKQDSTKATIAVTVSSSLSIFKWNLLDVFEHLYIFHWILKKKE